MHVLNNVGLVFDSIENLYEPTGSWIKDIRNRTIFGAIFSTSVCVNLVAQDFFVEGVKSGVASIPVNIGICVGIAALFPICELMIVGMQKAEQSSPMQLIGNQLNRRLLTPLGTALNFMSGNIRR